MHGGSGGRYGLYQCKVNNGSRHRCRHGWGDKSKVVPLRSAQKLRSMKVCDAVPICVSGVEVSKQHDFAAKDKYELVERGSDGRNVLLRGQVHRHDRDLKYACSDGLNMSCCDRSNVTKRELGNEGDTATVTVATG